MKNDDYLARLDTQIEEFVKFQFGGIGAAPPAEDPDPLIQFAAGVNKLVGPLIAEGRALMTASLQRAYAQGFDKGLGDGVCDGHVAGVADERKRLRFRALLAKQNGWFWMFVGVVAGVATTVAAFGIAQCAGF
jgi:hypothetical protein